MKKDTRDTDKSIFQTVGHPDCDTETFEVNYKKTMKLTLKKVAMQYHTNKENINPTNSKPLKIFQLFKLISKSSI